MTATQERTAYITGRLKQGATASEVIKEGYPSSTVYGVAKSLKAEQKLGPEALGEAAEPSSTRGRHQPRGERTRTSGDSTGTKARITQEEITLPGSIFLWYYMVREIHPEYDRSKSEWLQQVVSTFGRDYGEQMRRDYLDARGVDPMVSAEEGEDDDTGLDAVVGVEAASEDAGEDEPDE